MFLTSQEATDLKPKHVCVHAFQFSSFRFWFGSMPGLYATFCLINSKKHIMHRSDFIEGLFSTAVVALLQQKVYIRLPFPSLPSPLESPRAISHGGR